MKFFTQKIKYIALIGLLFCSGDDSQVIETLDNEKLTVKRFELAYETSIESISRMQNIEKKNLIEIINKDPEEVEEPLRDLNTQFQKRNFYERFREMMMANIIAERTGFTKRPEIKEILKQLEMQNVYQLYVTEQIEKKIKITDDQAQTECDKMRLEDKTGRVKAMTLDRCIMFGRAVIKNRLAQKESENIRNRIKEGITVKHNDKFDLDKYLETKGPKPTEGEKKSEPAKEAEPAKTTEPEKK